MCKTSFILYCGLSLLIEKNTYADDGAHCFQRFRALDENSITLGIIKPDTAAILRIVDKDGYRSLLLQEDNKEKTLTRINLHQPDISIEGNQREFLVSFLLTPVQGHSLIIGGHNVGLVNFLRHYTPAQTLDVVEANPVLAQTIQTWFALDNDERLTVHQTQEPGYLQARPRNHYDVIYMDTDVLFTRHLLDQSKSDILVRALWDRLTRQGLLLTTLDGDRQQIERQIDCILTVFPHVFVWENPENGTVMLAAFKHRQIINPLILRERARKLDRTIEVDISLITFIDRLLAGEYRVLEI